MTTVEEWRPVVGYGGLYEVSSHGRVRRMIAAADWNPRLLTPSRSTRGYLTVSLCRFGKSKSHKLHGVVAEAFIGPRPDGHVINHIDAVKANNASANLEYVTPQGNTDHARRLGLMRGPVSHSCGACRLPGHNVQTCSAVSP